MGFRTRPAHPLLRTVPTFVFALPRALLGAVDILQQTLHRPWPLPARPWMMYQRWHDLLFAHWALPAERVRPLVPRELDLDLFEGKAWIGVIPFWMSHVRFRGLPPIPSATTFPELNVRTYVRCPQQADQPGVYFFSLDAASLLAVLGARAGFGLPYFWADMHAELKTDEIQYYSVRRSKSCSAELRVRYGPIGPISARKSSLEQFVTERYCLYAVRRGRVHRVEIHHLPWPLQPAEAEFQVNTMAQANRLALSPGPPVLQFAKELVVYVFATEEIG